MTAIIVIGSNLGDRVAYMLSAVEEMGQLGEIIAVSGLYSSEPDGYENQGDFLNAAVQLVVDCGPEQLLVRLKEIETKLGRKKSFRNAPREIDIDIALIGDIILDGGELTVPHRGLAERDFFIAPIAEIAPDALDPRSHRKLSELRDNFPVAMKKIISQYKDERWQALIT
ncbi:MAG TPA: 2-amino-4-hydroxy-6-hydroxymethyldihydropteridine diphosphokinase [candidate division Zixibacteria bacterium]|nr:2-amino-4-hydroxy-6-hydroxymethyldihydropteridine diphosphokinase [candidate division Zixibacteria bacterium]